MPLRERYECSSCGLEYNHSDMLCVDCAEKKATASNDILRAMLIDAIDEIEDLDILQKSEVHKAINKVLS